MSRDGDLVVLVNPTAGRGRGAGTAARAVAVLKARGARARVVIAADFAGLVAAATAAVGAGVARLAVVGGDGTVRAAAAALAGSETALALIPCGRGNDLARALGVPLRTDLAAALAVNGVPRRIDLGRVGDDLFATIATFGFDAVVSRLVHRREVPGRGFVAYGLAIARTLFDYEAIAARLTGDFGVREGRFFLVASANTRFYGAGIPMAPDAIPDDGLLDVCIVAAVGRGRALRLLPRLACGRHVHDASVEVVRTRSLRIECGASEPVYADGEPMSDAPVTITVVPAAVAVVVEVDPRLATTGAGA